MQLVAFGQVVLLQPITLPMPFTAVFAFTTVLFEVGAAEVTFAGCALLGTLVLGVGCAEVVPVWLGQLVNWLMSA